MLQAHRAIESLTLDRELAHPKDELMPLTKLDCNGYWWSPEGRHYGKTIDQSQQYVIGMVGLKLYKGNVIVVGRVQMIRFLTKISRHLKRMPEHTAR